MKILQTSTNIYTLQNKNNTNFKTYAYINDCVSFKGATADIKNVGAVKKFLASIKTQYRKFMDPIENTIADGLAWLIQTKPAKKIVMATEKHKENGEARIKAFNAKNPNNQKTYKNRLFSHLIVLGSTLMSGFYVAKTLTNEKLDEQKKQTLAINQIAVFVASTIMAYTFDDMISKKTDAIKEEFKRINEGKPRWEDHLKGIEAAKKIMIFTTMYRFIAPVLVTPLANYIGNKLNEIEENRAQTEPTSKTS